MIIFREKSDKALSRNFFDLFQPLRKIVLGLFLLVLLSGVNESLAQRRNLLNQLAEIYGKTAYVYLLSANRPYYGVDAYVTDKGYFFVSTGLSYGFEYIDISLEASYGLSRKLELSAGLSPYTESYNFAGNKIKGFGDSYIGLKYRIHESRYFQHAVQVLMKVPTASSKSQLGTGRVDLHFGVAQSFFIERFGFDLGLELNFLHRRDIPSSSRFPEITRSFIDSINAIYNYKYEPELVISGGPSYILSERFYTYAGFSFSRNIRLDYNSSGFYGGLGVALSGRAGLGLGVSNDILEGGYWIFSSNFYITL